jgi:hypothetical protein
MSEILKAKYNTTLARASKDSFLRKWQWLAEKLNIIL